MVLSQFDHLPEGFLDVTSETLHRILPGPTLFHLAGRREQPIFLSILLHGNEDTGLKAVQRLLKKYSNENQLSLPRALSIFVGNIDAARQKVRRLDGQPDYNRIWPGGDFNPCPEAEMMAQVVEIMGKRRPFASIDIHNNTGVNPHYACVNRLDHRFFHLATLFSRTVVYFIRPSGVQGMAFAEFCPSVILECGPVGQLHGVEHATDYLDACLHLAEIPAHPIAYQDMDLFHTMAQVIVPDEASFSFTNDRGDFRFEADLDHLNFRELPEGTRFGRFNSGSQARLKAVDERGEDVSERYFVYTDEELRTRIPLMPSMLTLDARIIRQDCFCYIMERLDLTHERSPGVL